MAIWSEAPHRSIIVLKLPWLVWEIDGIDLTVRLADAGVKQVERQRPWAKVSSMTLRGWKSEVSD